MSDRQALEPTGALSVETVTRVHHWNEHLFSFSITRPASFRFRSGEFVMLGLPDGQRPLLRAFSIASPSYDETLEFLSIKVPNGPLTSRLQGINEGDAVFLGRKPTGTLVTDALLPGRRLFLLATGTGLAPFLSLARDPETYERYEKVVVTHTVRRTVDLAYRHFFEHGLPNDADLGEMVAPKLIYYPSVTRDAFKHQGRITDLITSGQLFADIGLPAFDKTRDRVMLCGGPSVLADLKQLLLDRGYEEGSIAAPGDFVLERAFVET